MEKHTHVGRIARAGRLLPAPPPPCPRPPAGSLALRLHGLGLASGDPAMGGRQRGRWSCYFLSSLLVPSPWLGFVPELKVTALLCFSEFQKPLPSCSPSGLGTSPGEATSPLDSLHPVYLHRPPLFNPACVTWTGECRLYPRLAHSELIGNLDSLEFSRVFHPEHYQYTTAGKYSVRSCTVFTPTIFPGKALLMTINIFFFVFSLKPP